MSPSVREPRRIGGRTVLAMLVGFFALVFAVDGVFAYFALASWPGFSQLEAYKTGLRYNEVLEAARRQSLLGWTSKMDFSADGDLWVELRDANGEPVSGLEVSVVLARPVSETHDLTLLLDPIEDGGYGRRVEGPVTGRWTVTVLAENAEGRHYRMTHDVMVLP